MENIKKIIFIGITLIFIGCFHNKHNDSSPVQNIMTNIDYESINIRSITSSEDYMFAIDQYDGLIAYEKNLNGNIVLINRYNQIYGNEVKYSNGYIYIISENNKKIEIYDVRKLENIKKVSEFSIEKDVKRAIISSEINFERKIAKFIIENNKLYILNIEYSSVPGVDGWGGDLVIIDVSDPKNLVTLKSIDTVTLPEESQETLTDISIDEKNIYISEEKGKVLVFNKEGEYQNYLNLDLNNEGQKLYYDFDSIKVKNSIMYLGVKELSGNKSMISFDIENLDEIKIKNKISFDEKVDEIRIYNNQLFICELRTINISALNEIQVLSKINSTLDFLVEGSYIYQGSISGIRVIDISDLNIPKEISIIPN